jgi:hypothetical protein
MYPSDSTIKYFIVILLLATSFSSGAIIRPIFTPPKKFKMMGFCQYWPDDGT